MQHCGQPVTLPVWMAEADLTDRDTLDRYTKSELNVVKQNGLRLSCWESRWTALVVWVNSLEELGCEVEAE